MEIFNEEENYLKSEVFKLIKEKKITIAEKDIENFKASFRKLLITKEILGNFRIAGLLIGVLIAAFFYILVFTLSKNNSFQFILGMVLIGLAMIIFLGYCGSKFSKKKKKIKIDKILDYVLRKLIKWTNSYLNLSKTDNLNKRRILIENLLIIYSQYISFKNIDYQKDFAKSPLKELFTEKKNIEAIKLSIYLFKIFFSENFVYKKNGHFVLKNVYMPLVYLSRNQEITQMIIKEKEKFERDTHLRISDEEFAENNIAYFFETNFKKNFVAKNNDFNYDSERNCYYFNKNTQVEIDREIFNKSDMIFCLFKDYWKTSYIYQQFDWDILNNSSDKIQYIKSIMEANQIESITLLNQLKENENDKKPKNEPKNSFYLSSKIQNEEIEHIHKLENFEKAEQTLEENEKQFLSINKSSSNDQTLNNVSSDLLVKLMSVKNEPEESFKKVMAKDHIRVYKKIDPLCPVILVKSVTVLKYHPQYVFNLLYDLHLRAKWDKIFSRWEIKKKIDETTDVVYSFIKAPVVVTDREFLQRRMVYQQFTYNQETFDYIIVFGNYQSPDFPEVSNIIRADTKISGYIMKQVQLGNVVGTEMTMISQSDIKGAIPKSLVNYHSKIKPVSWVETFERALEKYTKNNLKL